ncbi:endosome protein [Ephemerocybe angulata]|uniref:Endosome protein n=1 Tax=Ephemerocybe angulata TaxID=980116 RepID=A0A8H6M483_9AGAR|nr:endosome protein [Tulosesus angulatus]
MGSGRCKGSDVKGSQESIGGAPRSVNAEGDRAKVGFLDSLTGKLKDLSHHDHDHAQGAGSSTDAPLPEWSAAPKISHKSGKWNEAPKEEYQAGENFCNEYPPLAPHLLPSDLWPTTPRFLGHIQEAVDTKGGPAVTTVTATPKCKDTCLLSDMPILVGLAVCRPYPEWRMPGWNRLSAGLHLDDLRKFFEDPDGGHDYAEGLISSISPWDTIGCGYEFASGNLFYTYTGLRLPNAFSGLYIPQNQHDVFAAIGVEDKCQFQVFRWKEGNEWAWRVEDHVRRLSAPAKSILDEPYDVREFMPDQTQCQN